MCKLNTLDTAHAASKLSRMAKTASRTTRMSDDDYAVQVKLAEDKGISVADAIRFSLREGAPIVRRKLRGKKK